MVSSIGQLFDFVNKLQFKVFEDFRIKEHSVLVFFKKNQYLKNLWFWQNPLRTNGCHERTSKEPIGL